MIVVDTNVIAYLFLPGEYTPLAERLLQKDPDWVAPVLWRSELRNVFALYVRLVTQDKKVLAAFPQIAFRLQDMSIP